MTRGWFFNINYFVNRSIFEPWKIVIGDKNLSLSSEEKEKLPQIMNKYLIHNRSVLTDTTFIGFPFHYFYTAVFLLILFVGLCYIYAKKVESLNLQFGIED